MKSKLICYHYTNPEAYLSMRDGTNYREKGLLPMKRFVRLSHGSNLPNKAYDGVIEGLLEPEPKTWINNKEFPLTWNYLVHDFCRRQKTMLLSFEILSKDQAYVFERELYRKGKGQGESTKESMDEAVKKQWYSIIPAFEYEGGYSLPQFAIWTPVEFNRLKIEWVRDTRKIWKKEQKRLDKIYEEIGV